MHALGMNAQNSSKGDFRRYKSNIPSFSHLLTRPLYVFSVLISKVDIDFVVQKLGINDSQLAGVAINKNRRNIGFFIKLLNLIFVSLTTFKMKW